MSLVDTAQRWFFYKPKKGKLIIWIGNIFFGLVLLIPTINFKKRGKNE